MIFDYGEVISHEPTAADRAVIARLAGVSDDDELSERFWAAYLGNRDALDGGTLDIVGYWREIGDEIGVRWDAARVHQLWVADIRSWLSINPATIGVLDDLRAGGTRLALLSNAPKEFGTIFRHGALGGFFGSACYVSGELGLLKPEAAIFRHALDDLQITPGEAVFTDNKAANVAGAEALGITGHLFTDADKLRAFFVSLG